MISKGCTEADLFVIKLCKKDHRHAMLRGEFHRSQTANVYCDDPG